MNEVHRLGIREQGECSTPRTDTFVAEIDGNQERCRKRRAGPWDNEHRDIGRSRDANGGAAAKASLEHSMLTRADQYQARTCIPRRPNDDRDGISRANVDRDLSGSHVESLELRVYGPLHPRVAVDFLVGHIGY